MPTGSPAARLRSSAARTIPRAFISDPTNLYFAYTSLGADPSGFFMPIDAILPRAAVYGLCGELASWFLSTIAQF
jgi:hypothetical protein